MEPKRLARAVPERSPADKEFSHRENILSCPAICQWVGVVYDRKGTTDRGMSGILGCPILVFGITARLYVED